MPTTAATESPQCPSQAQAVVLSTAGADGNNLQAAARALVGKALDDGTRDNVSVLLVRLGY